MKSAKVHPTGVKRALASIDERDFISSGRKRLRKLPHVFSKVLELPLGSDADVAIEDWPDSLRFVAGVGIDPDPDSVRTQTVEIHPGVLKLVIRLEEEEEEEEEDHLEMDMWRYRLPESTQPELATADFYDGELVVTVPKGGGWDAMDSWTGSRFVLVHGV